MRQLLLLFVFLATSVTALSAQSYGHVNFGNLLSQMPDVSGAEAKLQAYEKEQIAEGERMVTVFQKEANSYQTRVQGGDMSPKDRQAAEAKLRERQRAIQAFEQQMAVNIEGKRKELLGPIIERARAAIDAVAKEGNYALVFDSSIFGTVLFAQPTTDLLPVVKAKLGIE